MSRNFDGVRLESLGLPPTDAKSWTLKRKTTVVKAVRTGAIDRATALEHYSISDEEFSLWEASIPEQEGEEHWLEHKLPPSNTSRWTVSRKAVVVEAVHAGAIDRTTALERYDISDEEFSLWESGMQQQGSKHNLRVTRLSRGFRSK
jgi:hypothetical protein